MTLALTSGFIIMVLEIVGTRLLARDFGNTLHVWTAQIGVVLVALAFGYVLGGWSVDRLPSSVPLAAMLIPAGIWLLLTPVFAPRLMIWIVDRHPRGAPIPPLWMKLDPILGSLSVFLVPCIALAALSPAMIRLGARRMDTLGRTSGQIIAANTLGSIAGVFLAGFVLIEYWRLSQIFIAMGVLTLALGVACLGGDRWFGTVTAHSNPRTSNHV
jgi:hypothetical protein